MKKQTAVKTAGNPTNDWRCPQHDPTAVTSNIDSWHDVYTVFPLPGLRRCVWVIDYDTDPHDRIECGCGGNENDDAIVLGCIIEELCRCGEWLEIDSLWGIEMSYPTSVEQLCAMATSIVPQ